MSFFKNIWAFRQLRCRRALVRQSSAILACGLLTTIPNAFLSCSKKSPINTAVEQKNTVVEPVETTAHSAKIDFDLTKMSATMIYSTIFDMLIMPEDYVEKNIKVKGWFEVYTNPETAELFYAVVVPDATACCQQGIEFVLDDSYSFPDDYPKYGDDVTVIGEFDTYVDGGYTYCTLRNAKIVE